LTDLDETPAFAPTRNRALSDFPHGVGAIKQGRIEMKKIMIVAAATVFTVTAAIASTIVTAPGQIEASLASQAVMPSSQELPFDKYWSKG
jgi:hypothetical protein